MACSCKTTRDKAKKNCRDNRIGATKLKAETSAGEKVHVLIPCTKAVFPLKSISNVFILKEALRRDACRFSHRWK